MQLFQSLSYLSISVGGFRSTRSAQNPLQIPGEEGKSCGKIESCSLYIRIAQLATGEKLL